ncbi:MAG: response regulator transcription factor [Caldilineaceae bacterium]|nr:response regulator transcription factor [Caldilineaceae bacterium]
MFKILVANRTSIIRNGLREIINNEDDFEFVGEVDSGYRAQRRCLQVQPHVAVLDSSLPGPSVPSLVDNLSSYCPKMNVLILADPAGDVDIRKLVEKGIGGCILQNERDTLIAHAIRAVGLGAAWFSRCFIAELLQQESDRPQNTGEECDLTRREREVAKHVAMGLSNRQIARSLEVKERTVEFHMTNILQKLHVSNRVAVAMYARDYLR